MHTCTNCDSYVTSDFVRVFGTEDHRVFGCPHCANMRELMQGVGGRVPDGESSRT
ncbi:DUF7563 family protein [Salinigranum marinum]|jgi:Zn finger protein HypA/HybF involved in hydrogenase expression|uniref:DUF7563 family protein n=1 Tax=Salinigranum marinum TaxID=1515595 RepID=UPI002989B962|nr:hypothetical protein [Salinigranum marinum]